MFIVSLEQLMHGKMKVTSRKKKTAKQSQNGKAKLLNGDGSINSSPDITSIQQGELEASGVLTMPSEQELQPFDFRVVVPKTEPDCFPLNPPNVEVKTEPGVCEARESGLSLKEENEEEWKDVKQEWTGENSEGD